jgi:hypothetical protein
MSDLHVIRSKDAAAVLHEFAEILWSQYGETVVDAVTNKQLAMGHAITSDELLRAGFMAGVRVAMVQSLSGNIEVEFLHGKQAEVPPKDGSKASLLRTPVRSLRGLALRRLRRRFWGR